MLNIVILAAGKGTRMKSQLPKVLHPVAGRPLLQHVVDTARQLDSNGKINIVVGYGAQQVEAQLVGDDLRFILQSQQLGTGHAVAQALPHINEQDQVLILYGDVPLIKKPTLEKLINCVTDRSLGLLTIKVSDPSGYGRIVRDHDGAVTAIVEHKDASAQQRAIAEVNTGIMAVNGADLQRWLPALSNKNAQGEYYLTDIIGSANADGIQINTEQPADEWEVLGMNDRIQQAQLERRYQLELAEKLMAEGVTLLDPQRFDCRGELKVGADVVIDVNCIFEGKVSLGNGVSIGPNCLIKNTTIGDGTIIKANTVIEDSTIANNCEIGPFSRFRPGVEMADKAKAGNFVEIKKSVIGHGSKVNHLTYVGDSLLGSNVNVGAGTITCNYDGANKSLTEIGDGAFIGSNTALVAPVKVGKGATIGAGSTINKAVPDDHLAVARAKQINIEGWERPKKKS